MTNSGYDCAIAGGGVAGLSLAILLARSGKKVVLFEKETYPFHKVCGEYISNESVPFLEALGINFKEQELPEISQLALSSPSGILIKRPLDIGGTGLSRYELDNQLYQLALKEGVTVYDGTKVRIVVFKDNTFHITTDAKEITARTLAGAFGKNSNLDIQLNRDYKSKKDQNLFIAVKHHIRADFDKSCVEIHNFENGYCGLSAIEDGKINMSYISKISNLKKQGSIAEMEKNILSRNPHLKKYFQEAEFIFEKPLTISHLYFEIKEPVTQHILMLGDAAGNIAPLSGNGMSMALQSSKLAHAVLVDYLNNKITPEEMESRYSESYSNAFANRIRIARYINSSFGQSTFTDLSFRFLKLFPGLVDTFSKRIHGDIF